MVALKRLIAILLACALAVQPVYADNGKMGKRQKTKEEIEIEKAENEKEVSDVRQEWRPHKSLF